MKKAKMVNKIFKVKWILILLLLLFSFSVLSTVRMPDESEIDIDSWSEYDRIISGFEVEDQKLVNDAVAKLGLYFDAMEQQIEPFLDDLYSYTSRAKMVWYLASDIRLRDVEGEILPEIVRTGTRLPTFIEGKFSTHFGSSSEVNQNIGLITDDIVQELTFNNERLAVELGELVSTTLKDSEKITQGIENRDYFADRAKRASTNIVSSIVGLQTGMEAALFAGELMTYESLATYLASYLAAKGLITIGSTAAGVVTFGVTTAIWWFVSDVVANRISRSTLRPKIRKVLELRRKESVAAYKRSIIQMIKKFHHSRRNHIEDTLNIGILFKIKSFCLLDGLS